MNEDPRRSAPPTIIDVARESGVSYSTVSRVLNGYEFVKPTTRARVLQAAEKLGYVPNPQARSLAGGRSNLIGVLVPGIDNGYISELLRGIDEELAKSDYNLIVYTTRRQTGRESVYAATIMNGAADGLLLVAPMISANYISLLRDHQFPLVLIDQSDMTGKNSFVDATNWQGAYDATQYLIRLGHQRIGFIGGLQGTTSAADRLDGYLTALADHNLPQDSRLIVPGHYVERGGYDAALALLDIPDRPTAIFAANDLSAFGAMEAIQQRGLRIPEDISLVGFDNLPQASLVYPKLTTIHQPLEQMGQVAVKMLLEQIQNPELPPRHVTLATQLIVRDSCRPLTPHNLG
jgi:LacI family transcriptional regulator